VTGACNHESVQAIKSKPIAVSGGSDPFLVLGTDDLDAVVESAVAARLENTGQACNAAKRFIVIDDLYEPFLEKFTAAMTSVKPEDPTSEDATLGPLSSAGAADQLDEQVQRAVAATDRTLRDLWSIVASHSSIAPTVRARIGPADPLWWLTREPDVRLRDREQWMLRVVDAPAAIAARGFPASVQLSLPLWIEDDERPGNSGLWELAVTGGRGHLIHSPEATHPVTMGARGFAALYAGIPMATLRLAGLAAGGNPVADSELDGAFAGSSFMLDSF